MKNLLLLRHAEADFFVSGSDKDRHLTSRGSLSAGICGGWLESRNLLPDLVLCSTALRTRETLAAFSNFLSDNVEVLFLDSLYNAAAEDICQAISLYDSGDIFNLMVVCHQPGISEFAGWFSSVNSSEDALYRLGVSYPPATLAHFSFEGFCENIGFGEGNLVDYITFRES